MPGSPNSPEKGRRRRGDEEHCGRLRASVLRMPDELSLDFEDVPLAASDGVPIEAGFLPRDDAKGLLVCNHPLNFDRYGCSTDEEPSLSLSGWAGNDFEVDHAEDYRMLHDAGYAVLTYDQRGMGRRSRTGSRAPARGGTATWDSSGASGPCWSGFSAS